MGVTAESAVTPTVIVALSAHHALSPAVIDSDSKQSLQEEESRGIARGGQGGQLPPLFLNENFKLRNYKLIFDKNVVLQLT